MRVLLFLWFLVAATGLRAQALAVASGEHNGFTRLVIESPEIAGWQAFRTEEGYAIRLRQSVRFDLSKVFDRIGNNRISAIWTNPETGNLEFRVACPCHLLPYQLSNSMLVLDLRDGAPPAGSSFEMSADGQTLPALKGDDPVPTQPEPMTAKVQSDGLAYEWVERALAGDRSTSVPQTQLETPTGPQLDGLRESLLRDLGAGAARGVVDLALPDKPDQGGSLPDSQNQIRIGQDLGMIAIPGGKEGARDNIALSGQICISDEQLDISSWGREENVVQALVLVRQGMFDELDRPDPETLSNAARYHLHLGFGAEARQLLRLAGPSVPDSAMLQAMSWGVDNQTDPEDFFRDFANCDTPAALWAALGATDLSDLPDLNNGAVVQAFAALPPKLRQTLGPGLAEKFMDIGQVEQARVIKSAIIRGLEDVDTATRLISAKVDLQMGDSSDAVKRIEEIAQQNSEVLPQALIDLVDLRLLEGESVAPDEVELLAALTQEHREAKIGQDLRRAYALALATAGRFDEAFEQAAILKQDFPDIWRLLAAQGENATLLIHAVRDPKVTPPEISWPVRHELALRLEAAGLPNAGLYWLQETKLPDLDPDATELLRARLLRANFDYDASIQELTGRQDPEAGEIRAGLLLDIEDAPAAADQFSALGDVEGLAAARRLAGDWLMVPQGEGPWADLLKHAQIPEPTDEGPLAQSKSMLDESAAARQRIEDLLLQTAPAP